MGWLKDVFDRIIGNSDKAVDGKFQMGDLFTPAGTINAITGNDKREQSNNGKFDISDLFHMKGLVDWAGNLNLRKDKGEAQAQEQATQDTMQDNSAGNIEQMIDSESLLDKYLKHAEEQQTKQWAREDQIRLETQQREDTAYSRAIEDLRNSGVNVNLLGNINPADSGGGITNATGQNYSLYENELEAVITLLEQELDQAFEGEENKKDRVAGFIERIMQILAK